MPASATLVTPAARKARPARSSASASLLDRRVADRALDQRQRRLADDAGRLAVLVAVDPAAVRVGRVAVDAGQRQRPAVGGADVVAHPQEQDRVVGRDRVEVGAGRVAAVGEPRVVVAATDDPSPGRPPGRACRTSATMSATDRVRRGREIQVLECESDEHRDGSGRRSAPASRSGRGGRSSRSPAPAAARTVGLVAGRDDDPAADRDRRDLRTTGLHRQDPPVNEHEFAVHLGQSPPDHSLSLARRL